MNKNDYEIGIRKMGKESCLTKWFKELGYSYHWDFSKSDNLYWYEFIDPDSGKLVVQIESGISKKRFLKEFWFCDKDDKITFFIAGKENSKEWGKLSDKIEVYLNEKTKKNKPLIKEISNERSLC